MVHWAKITRLLGIWNRCHDRELKKRRLQEFCTARDVRHRRLRPRYALKVTYLRPLVYSPNKSCYTTAFISLRTYFLEMY
eukprot:3632383-Amphidinium_carterae.1